MIILLLIVFFILIILVVFVLKSTIINGGIGPKTTSLTNKLYESYVKDYLTFIGLSIPSDFRCRKNEYTQLELTPHTTIINTKEDVDRIDCKDGKINTNIIRYIFISNDDAPSIDDIAKALAIKEILYDIYFCYLKNNGGNSQKIKVISESNSFNSGNTKLYFDINSYIMLSHEDLMFRRVSPILIVSSKDTGEGGNLQSNTEEDNKKPYKVLEILNLLNNKSYRGGISDSFAEMFNIIIKNTPKCIDKLIKKLLEKGYNYILLTPKNMIFEESQVASQNPDFDSVILKFSNKFKLPRTTNVINIDPYIVNINVKKINSDLSNIPQIDRQYKMNKIINCRYLSDKNMELYINQILINEYIYSIYELYGLHGDFNNNRIHKHSLSINEIGYNTGKDTNIFNIFKMKLELIKISMDIEIITKNGNDELYKEDIKEIINNITFKIYNKKGKGIRDYAPFKIIEIKFINSDFIKSFKSFIELADDDNYLTMIENMNQSQIKS
jgi:hypothetical protein